MKKKLNCILLIDDDYATNFFHQIVIDEGGFAENVVVKNSAEAALIYLKTPYNLDSPRPNLIFLDINMPRMNGWEFLEEYHHLLPEQQAETVIIMLSTSCSSEDYERANKCPYINEYRSKPLTDELLEEVIEKYWLADSEALVYDITECT